MALLSPGQHTLVHTYTFPMLAPSASARVVIATLIAKFQRNKFLQTAPHCPAPCPPSRANLDQDRSRPEGRQRAGHRGKAARPLEDQTARDSLWTPQDLTVKEETPALGPKCHVHTGALQKACFLFPNRPNQTQSNQATPNSTQHNPTQLYPTQPSPRDKTTNPTNRINCKISSEIPGHTD